MVDRLTCRENTTYVRDFIPTRPSPKLIRNAEIAQKYLQHRLSAQQLADELGVSKQMILGRLRAAGVHGEKRGRDPDNFRLPNPPYGKRVVAGRLETNSAEMKIVRLVVEFRDRQGWSFEKIAAELTKRGHRNRKGGRWYRAAVRLLHQNWAGKV